MLTTHDMKEQFRQEQDGRITDATAVAVFRAWLDTRIGQSKRLPANRLFSEIVEITPAIAAFLLSEKQWKNRKLKHIKVATIAQSIRDGRWKVTGQTISFNRDGSLNNGQHRLHAIVEAEIPVEIMVVFGETKEDFDVIDTGTIRGGSDTLDVEGVPYSKIVAAAVRLLILLDRGVNSKVTAVTNDVILEFVRRNQEIVDITAKGCAIGGKLKCGSTPIAAALFLIKTKTKASQEVFDEFLDKLLNGGERDYVNVLRDSLMTNSLSDGIASQTRKSFAIMAAIVRTWGKHIRKAHTKGRKGRTFLVVARWQSGPFPEVE